MLENNEKNIRSVRIGQKLCGWVRKGTELIWQHPPYVEIYSNKNSSFAFFTQGSDMSEVERVNYQIESGNYYVKDLTGYSQPIKNFYVQGADANKLTFNWFDFNQLTSFEMLYFSNGPTTVIYNKCIFPKNGNFKYLLLGFKGENVEFIDSPIVNPTYLCESIVACPNLKKIDLSNIKLLISVTTTDPFPDRNLMFNNCPNIEEIDFSGIEIDVYHFEDSLFKWIGYLITKNGTPNLKKIITNTYFWYALYFFWVNRESEFYYSNLPQSLYDAMAEIYETATRQAAVDKIIKGTHPNFIITDVNEKYEEFWESFGVNG